MKCFPSVIKSSVEPPVRASRSRRRPWTIAGLCLVLAVAAFAALPDWMANVENKSAIEDAFFRLMSMPAGAILGRRPPMETRPALSRLIKNKPDDAQLYSLRALEDEQELDFAAAESDWTMFARKAPDAGAAGLALADFYHRRVRPADEIRVLTAVGRMPSPSGESLSLPVQQRSWAAFERSLQVAQAHAMPADASVAQYQAWIARYPRERAPYVRLFQFLLDHKDASAAQQAIAGYQKAFPEDTVFPVKAKALLDYQQGSLEQGLAVYDRAFQPLWPPELVQNFFALLKETRSTRKYADRWRAQLDAHPDDINTLARLFYYYQQQGKLDVAQRTIDEYRLRKEGRKASWSADELFILARLLEQVHAYPEASRYYYALYNVEGSGAQEKALGGLISILLTAPEQPLRLGAGEISLYQDIATLDQGPGFLNGIVSLILNTTNPANAFSQEEQRAVPYFHRAKAAELLARFDQAFPASARRPDLHAQLIEMYADYGASDAVIREGRQFLADFAGAPQRTQVSLRMADAYARTNQTREEFAIYDAVLQELAQRAQQVPLGSAFQQSPYEAAPAEDEPEAGVAETPDCEEGCQPAAVPRSPHASRKAFAVGEKSVGSQAGPRSPEYARVLERYLSRLVELKQLPQALAVLRRELDRNPNDPGLYERLASFLQQNQIGAETEQVYKRAIRQFQDRSWYDKLARWYLAQKRRSDFEQLSSDVVRIFDGTDLARYFQTVVASADYQIGPQMYLKLNQYAHERFPHNLTFVNNLLAAYSRKETWDPAAYERLLRAHWMESPSLRDVFFQRLSGPKLEAELRQAEQDLKVAGGNWDEAASKDPAETRFVAEAELWRSHFEAAAAPLGAVARLFPADVETGDRASSVFRSLAYQTPGYTDAAVAIEQNLLKADPGNRQIMARIGDIYADRERFADAAPYWDRIAQIEPGNQGGYLDAATIYWDYFDFDNALRLLHDGRTQLHRPDLYAYEAGAIYEGKREYPQAVSEYLKGALAQEGYTPSRGRLLQLATRPTYRDLLEQATTSPVASANPSPAAIDLRIAVLEAQLRTDDLEKFLIGLVERSTSLEVVENLETIGQQKSLESVRQRALERQAELTTDPIRRLELRYELVRFYEGKKDFAAAQRNIEALYREHPKILGVVRATVDFYWRTRQKQPAIDVLLEASKAAYPALATRFRFEAARKMTDAGQYEQARRILIPLMQSDPHDSEYLAAMADTFARAGDDQGLKKFYLDKISFFQNDATLDPGARTSHIAALRRGLIPALTRLKDYAGAVDQYIAILNNYPEDEGLTTEAAFYAGRYSLPSRLLDFYKRTVQQSPRDVRWPVVLARLQADFEDYPAAIDSYGRAIGIRPDRIDLLTARAGLLERLMRFDDAAADYQKLYELQYKDPKWMEKIAELRARQGNSDAAVQALKLALIQGRPPQPQNFFQVSQRLEGWGMLPQARDFADQGMRLAGESALSDPQNQGGVQLWIRILTRQRKQDDAWKWLDGTLLSISKGVDASLATTPADSDENKLKRASAMQRRDSARRAVASGLREMGLTVDRYFVPEERAQFAAYLAQKRAIAGPDSVNEFLIPLAQAARLPELEAKWRFDMLMQGPELAPDHLARLKELQTQRLRFHDLGTEMEARADRAPRFQGGAYFHAAAEAYRTDDDWRSELRVLTAMRSQNLLGGAETARYYELLLAHDRPNMIDLAAAGQQSERDAAANFVVSHADSTTAQSAVAARGHGMPPVWTPAYSALVGLYFRDSSPQVDGAFRTALGQATIGQSLGKPVDRSRQLAGDIWFYYGSRYGEYLGSVTRKPNAEDYLPASLEQTPGRAAAYETLAQYYSDAGEPARAISDYDHALELTPERADIHDKLALIYWKENNRAQARQDWRQALSILKRQVDRRQVPESFWRDFGAVMDHVGARHIFADFRAPTDALLRGYMRKNGTWRNTSLLRDAYRALGDDTAGVAWLLDLAAVAPNPQAVVAEFVNDRWIPAAYKEPVYRRLLQYAQDEVARSAGMARDYAVQNYHNTQLLWISYLLQAKQFERARTEYEAADAQAKQAAGWAELRLKLDAAQGRLDATLDEFRRDPEHVPSLDVLRVVATDLQKAGDKASARKLLEYAFTREIEEHRLSAPTFFGLAEIRLDSGDLKGALELLHRATLVIGKPFDNLDAAASLLLKTGHPAEAVGFLEALIKAEPWNTEARLKLAQARIKAGQDVPGARAALLAIARSPMDVPYAIRLAAASAAAPSSERIWGSNELRLIGSGAPVSPADATHPFFYEARLKAAAEASSPALRVQLLRAAIEDFPDRDAARIPMFRAALKAKQDRLALASLGRLLQTLSTHLKAEEPAESPNYGVEDDAQYYASSMRIPADERLPVATDLATAMENLDRLQEALGYLRIAASLEKVADKKSAIEKRIADLRARIRRRQQNDARRPVIHPALEQDRVVRPMLLARSAPPPPARTQGRTP